MTIIGFFKKLDGILTGIEERLIYLLMASMLTIVFLAVLNRFLIQLPMSWSEEVARYLMIWIAFVGASLGVKHSVHISVDALVHAIPPAAQRMMAQLGNVLSFAFCAWFFYIGAEFIGRLMDSGQLSPALRMPIYYAYAAVPCGFALMSVRYLISFVYLFYEKSSDVRNESLNIEGAMERGKQK